jgi:hypothetical protein
MTSARSDQPQSFLSTLRERSAIVFTIGLALSIASFVENLHMGKDAIAFLVAELSKIDGWADAVQAVAAIIHGTLEWWRAVLRDLLSFVPFHVPQWLHDPISFAFFAATRTLNRIRSATPQTEFEMPEPGMSHRVHDRLQHAEHMSTSAYSVVDALWRATTTVVIPLSALSVLDDLLYRPHLDIPKLLSFAGLVVLVATVLWLFRTRSTYWNTKRQDEMEHHRQVQRRKGR